LQVLDETDRAKFEVTGGPGIRAAERAHPAARVERGLTRPSNEALWAGALALSLVAAWEIAARLGVISALFFPSPLTIAETLVEMTADGTLAFHLGATLSRMVVGLATGGSLGLVLGLAIGWSARLRRFTDPIIAAVYPIPKLALFPLLLLIFGLGETPKLLLISLAVFFPMLINSAAGVRQLNPVYWMVAENYGARGLQVFRRVLLPGSLPSILAGLRLAISISVLISIGIELSYSENGLGAIIWLAWQTLRTRDLYAALFVISVLGIVLNVGLQIVSRRLVPWQSERE
jgi:NitT/TauT family transport system permease protein